ncbi:unnamed protein product [Polarella glacialis]|uniref:Reverse transcriptase domain-containing protein n=1 Tax=Polarella glacialis TaxID=89957 RepID=A0A813I0K4_POLGL|nr:unnamed protein product [Polarella glacialis]
MSWRVASWNCCGTDSCPLDFADEVQQQTQCDVLCLQELKLRSGDDDLVCITPVGSSLYFSKPSRRRSMAICIPLNEAFPVEWTISGHNAVLALVRHQAGNLLFLCARLPTETHGQVEFSNALEELSSLISQCPYRVDAIVSCIDANCEMFEIPPEVLEEEVFQNIGPMHIGNNLTGTMANNRGTAFYRWLLEHDLALANTNPACCYKRDLMPSDLITHTPWDTNKRRRQIDYIAISEPYTAKATWIHWEVSAIAPTISDHKLLLFDVLPFLQRCPAAATNSKAPNATRRPRTKTVGWMLRDVEANMKYHELCQVDEGATLNSIQSTISHAANVTGCSFWPQDGVSDEGLRALEAEFRCAPNHTVEKAVLAKKLSKLRKFMKQEKQEKQLDEWASGKWGWKKGLQKRCRRPVCLKACPDSRPAYFSHEWSSIIGEHYTELFDTSDIHKALDHLQSSELLRRWRAVRRNGRLDGAIVDITISALEVWDVFNNLRLNKAGGADGIAAEMLLQLPWGTVEAIAAEFTRVVNGDSELPADWSCAFVVLIEKVKSASVISDFRPISLISVLLKALMRVALNRIRGFLEQGVTQQFANIKGRQGLEMISTVRLLVEKSAEWRLPLVIVKMDIKRAFDSVLHSTVLHMCEDKRVPLVWRAFLASTFNNMIMNVSLAGASARVPMSKGVRQGSPESALIFGAVLDFLLAPVIRKWQDNGRGVQIGDSIVHHCLFADDLIVFASSCSKAEAMILDVVQALQVGDLQVRPAKCQWISNEFVRDAAHGVAADGVPLKCVNDIGLPVLGSLVTPDARTHADFEARMASAWRRFWSLKDILLRRNCPIAPRLRILDMTVMKCLLWNSQTWKLTSRQKRQAKAEP